MSLKAPFRFPLAVPLPELPLAPMVVGAVVRCSPTGSCLVSWLVAGLGSQVLVCCCFVPLSGLVGEKGAVSMTVIRLRQCLVWGWVGGSGK